MGGKTSTVSHSFCGNGGFDGYVSVSHRGGADYKEASRPEYRMWGSRSNNGVLTGRIRHGISAANRGSSNGWHPPWRGAKGGNFHKEKVK